MCQHLSVWSKQRDGFVVTTGVVTEPVLNKVQIKTRGHCPQKLATLAGDLSGKRNQSTRVDRLPGTKHMHLENR
ncbi:hypothetical protein DBV39_07530 [Orrella marina]|uniref:Uncharacterized protein n=1 Tax=Orrella marina TaxID=2163011 RepID=A0A2R4XID6_9BURK|nr:hypothetical protein DBV39_07530 [Orrella marina]